MMMDMGGMFEAILGQVQSHGQPAPGTVPAPMEGQGMGAMAGMQPAPMQQMPAVNNTQAVAPVQSATPQGQGPINQPMQQQQPVGSAPSNAQPMQDQNQMFNNLLRSFMGG